MVAVLIQNTARVRSTARPLSSGTKILQSTSALFSPATRRRRSSMLELSPARLAALFSRRGVVTLHGSTPSHVLV